ARRVYPTRRRGDACPLLLGAATAETAARALPAAAPDRAEALARIRAAAWNLTTGAPLWQAYDRWVRAELRCAEGHLDADEWLELVAAFGLLERPYELARVRLRLARALLARGPGAETADDDRERAAELLRQTGAVARHLGARPLAEAAEGLARRARLPLGRGQDQPADPARELGLTEREREVLRLVAAGRSNRQIAEELFISPKTASVHVSHILAKLGVSGRGEAAALAHRRRLFAPAAPG
ncbi:LuxR C-terminal-related transcriptional regulator, partial [Streptomyces sp. NPDC058045]|uniref:helix-turn-helix transcriptional regulator n=1 Tax=Streptomyces sp. NPDC058045 TaxID=3346311 RepID=UPI0036EEB3EA